MKLKKGDTVKVISGKEKGKIAKIKFVLSEKNRVVLDGVNIVKKHQKNQGDDKPKGIIEFEAPLHASNVMIIDPDTNKPTRIGYKFEKGKKIRIAKKSGTQLDK